MGEQIMAGSYNHAVDEATGKLYRPEDFRQMVENLGDAYETVEEMYGMIWWLANGDPALVESARQAYRDGLRCSPGTDGELGDAR